MIVFDLRCSGGHVFEAWFASSAAYAEQRDKAQVECPLCGDRMIEKAVMAPQIAAKGNTKPDMPNPQAMKAAMFGMMALVYLLYPLISATYYAGFESSGKQATLGKMAVGIKVVRSNGERLTKARAFGRYWAMLLSSFTLGIGFLMAAFTERKQGLHDMICDTLVVDRWAYTDQPQLQRHELGTVTIVILVLTGLLTVAGLVLLVAAVGFIAKMAS